MRRSADEPRAARSTSLTDRRALPYVALAAIGSMVVYALAGRALTAPWIIPDELIYSELAKSLASGSLPSVRGEVTFGYGLVYPAVIAPAWLVFDDPARAYAAAKLISAAVMALTAFPAYFLARRFVTPSSAAVVAAFSVFVPSMLLSGTLLIEPVLYPIFVLALLAITASVQRPTRRNQILVVAAIALACLTKPLSVVLAPAYVLAVVHLGILDRRQGGSVRSRLEAHATALTVIGGGAVLAIVGPALRGDPGAALGVYAVVLGHIDPGGMLVWFVRHLAGLDLYVAVVPFAATAVVVGRTFLRSTDARPNEFAAISLWTVGGTLAAVAAYSSKPLAGAVGYMPSEARFHERNIFVLVPLLLLGLAMYLERRRPATNRLLVVAALLSAALPLLLPLDSLLVNANFQALSVIPWTAGGIDRFWPFVYLPLGVLAVVALLRRGGTPDVRAWAIPGCFFLVTLVAAHASMSHPEGGATSTLGIGMERRWIDRAVPPGAEVVALWATPERREDAGAGYRIIWMSEFFNRTVGRVVEVGSPMPYDLPHTKGVIGDGVLRDSAGAPIVARYLLAPCSLAVRGRVVAGDPRVAARVYRVGPGPIRLASSGAEGGACDARPVEPT